MQSLLKAKPSLPSKVSLKRFCNKIPKTKACQGKFVERQKSDRIERKETEIHSWIMEILFSLPPDQQGGKLLTFIFSGVN